jgi:CheY-like chemotaxis protein
MPGEDGLTLITKVRRLDGDHGGSTPAIALTAYARSEDRVRAMRHGFQMHIAKPVEAQELVMMVATLSGRAEKQAAK